MMAAQQLICNVYKMGKNNLELIFWITALIILATMNLEGNHLSLCPISQLGFEFCPGCGIGHSIGFLFHGNLEASFEAHPLGIFALVMLTYRIIQLTKNTLKPKY